MCIEISKSIICRSIINKPAYFVVLDSTYLPKNPKSLELPELLFKSPVKLSSDTIGPVCVVVPDTVKFPVTVKLLPIVTLLGKPTVTVPELSATSTSLEVPAKVIVPPNAVAVELEPSLTV